MSDPEILLDEIEALATVEAPRQIPPMADAHDLMAEAAQRRLDRLDRLYGVELGRFLVGVAHCAILVAQVVDKPDTHHTVALPLRAFG